MIRMDEFIDKLLKAAAEAGIDPAEVYCQENSSFSAEAMEGNIDSYEVTTALLTAMKYPPPADYLFAAA